MPAVSLVFTSIMPAAVQFSFLVSSLFSALQSTIFRNPGFRRWANMTPLPVAPKIDANQSRLRLKESFSKQVGPGQARGVLDGSVGSAMAGFQDAKNTMMQKAREHADRTKFKAERREAERREELAQKRIAEEQREANERRLRERDLRRAKRRGKMQ